MGGWDEGPHSWVTHAQTIEWGPLLAWAEFFMEFFDVVHENRKILYVSGVFHVKFEPKRIKNVEMRAKTVKASK